MYYTVKFRNGDDVQVVRMDEFPVENAFDAVLQATMGAVSAKVNYTTRVVAVEATYEVVFKDGRHGSITMPVIASGFSLEEPLSAEVAADLWDLPAEKAYKRYGFS